MELIIQKQELVFDLGTAVVVQGVDLSQYDRNGNSIIDRTETICNYYVLGEQVNSLRIVYRASDGKIYKANASEYSQCERVVGMTLQAGNTGDRVLVVSSGLVYESGWGLEEGSYFLAQDGGVTKNPTGNICEVGYAVDSNSMIIQKGIKIRRL
ncbi:MAG: hypothetical protein ACPLX7_10450 [Candidatus Kapaibacteriota bacterium]